jgi:hypothetical protein
LGFIDIYKLSERELIYDVEPSYLRTKGKTALVAHPYNPNYLGAEIRRITA